VSDTTPLQVTAEIVSFIIKRMCTVKNVISTSFLMPALTRQTTTCLAAAWLVIFSLSGCVLPRREAAVPSTLTEVVQPLDAQVLRYWPTLDSTGIERAVVEAEKREVDSESNNSLPLPAASYLALSGGGDGGAFGAGLLVGWSDAGTRPEFTLVTGISAGALLAPFAFLGPRYDYVLREVSNQSNASHIYRSRGMLALLTSDGMNDDVPLRTMIDKYITADVLDQIAEQYKRGRLLFVGTTDLDMGQPVIWDMGAIAAEGDAAALRLFRQIILASAAIPGIFPPVMLDVQWHGQRYQEMHVDGAVTRQVFLLPPDALEHRLSHSARIHHIYVVRNGRLDNQWQCTLRRTTAVAHRAIDTIIDQQVMNDVSRLELSAIASGADFHLAYIGNDFAFPHSAMFSADYLQHLYEYAHEMAARGHSWSNGLPVPAAASVQVADSDQHSSILVQARRRACS
jgi:predicted acylesterase/phospholipase RssA